MPNSQFIPGQSDLGGTLPAVGGNLGGQAALASGAEVTVNVTMSRPFNAVNGSWIFLVSVSPAAAEANVLYVAQINGAAQANSSGATQVGVKVKNVGSAASAQTWSVTVLAILIPAM